MRGNSLSKGSGFSSFFNTNGNTDESLEIIRISLKKQLDRKQKLQKLTQKYQQITNQQKTHIKSIKASIIELKDVQTKSKTKFFVNPIIYVDNNLAKQTREYLCMLLNSFYLKYDENTELQFKTKQVNIQMNQLLQQISKNQEMLLKIEKETIGQQAQLEGELLELKNILKEQVNKSKNIQQQFKRVNDVCLAHQNRYNIQLDKVVKLRQKCQTVENKIQLYKNQIAQGEMVKRGKQQLMAKQMAYEEKFSSQLQQIEANITKEEQREKEILRKIQAKKQQVEKLRSKLNQTTMIGKDKLNYDMDMIVIDLKKHIKIR